MSDPSYREMISAGVMEAQLEATSGASGWATGTTPTDNLYRAGGENSLKAAFQCDCIEKWEFITVNVETPLLMNIASLGLVGRGLNDARRGQQSAQETFGGWSGATPGAETRRWLQAMKVGQVKICPGRSCPITQKLTKEQKDAVSSTYVGFEPKQYFSWFWGVDQCLLIKSEIRQVGGESFTTQVDSPVGKVTITYTLTRRTHGQSRSTDLSYQKAKLTKDY